MDDIYREIVAFIVLALFILITTVLCHNQDLQIGSIDKVIENRVTQEFTKRYRNLPRIEIEKVYSMVATGDDIVIDTIDEK